MEIGLQYYPRIDISRATSSRVTHIGRAHPAGTLVHTTGGADSRAWLTGGSAASGAPASCDELIRRDGTALIICPSGSYPYHAGQSSAWINGEWKHGNAVSEALIGYELECLDDQTPTYAQIDSLSQRICVAARRYGWRWPFVIYGHYGIAEPAGRRSDPRYLDWGSFMGRLYVSARAMDVPGL
jgi:N-acetyl-anhydromuramyl-L-alanine amidase AmpD